MPSKLNKMVVLLLRPMRLETITGANKFIIESASVDDLGLLEQVYALDMVAYHRL